MMLALAGFFLIVGWFIVRAFHFYALVTGDAPPEESGAILGIRGAATFLAAWTWSLLTSLQIRRNAPPEPPAPPRIRL